MPEKDLTSYQWRYSYKTSSALVGGEPVSILHDFYIPALSRSVRYDRVAGYFRSSSLAAASQGFTAFTQSGGSMRMITGAELAPEDITAILRGDELRLSACLEQALEPPDAWAEDVARGVSSLCRMVAKGVLEIRVGVRLHAKTGRPLPLTAVDDGYVHEKWGVLTDRRGNRLCFGGSLNESHRALVRNAENIELRADWWGDIFRSMTDEAQADFERLWENRHPAFRVLPLPQAIREKLVRIGEGVSCPAEIDGTVACQEIRALRPSAAEMLRFALIRNGPKLPGGRYVGMVTAPVEPWPHQEIVARRLVETWPYSYLLCDEVGLGKTIEAGLAIRSLCLSGLARRVLIAAPASLTEQWHREMAAKFLLPFARTLGGASCQHACLFPQEQTVASGSLYEPDLCIISTGMLSRKERKKELRYAEKFDIALVDEAHYARRKNPTQGIRVRPRFGNLYKTIRDELKPGTRSLWLATATPMQLDWVEVHDLLRLTDRVGPFQNDPSLALSYYETLGTLIQGRETDPYRWAFLRDAIRTIPRLDPFLSDFLHNAVIDSRIRMAARQWLGRGRIPKGADLRNIRRLIFAAAPLSRVMLRHTRPLLEIYRRKGELGAGLAKREILPIPDITFTRDERKAYDELEAYCGGLTAQITRNAKGKAAKTRLGFLLNLLRLRFASGMYAIRKTLERRLEKIETAISAMPEYDGLWQDADDMEAMLSGDEGDEEGIIAALLRNRSEEDLIWEQGRLNRILYALGKLPARTSKTGHLLKVLDERRTPDGRIGQTVVFTKYYDTLTDIVRQLRAIDPSMRIGTYSGRGGQYAEAGKLISTDRETVKKLFLNQETDILICTDAAAEGLNLQTADLLINYDLPWNPMKVEQRIGRIDRIGQKHEKVQVLNLCYADSVEETVYGRLLTRLARAGNIVGTQQIAMLPVRPDEFSDLAEGKLSPDELEARAKQRLGEQLRRTRSMEMSANDLYEIYRRMRSDTACDSAPVSLDDIWQTLSESEYLKNTGCRVMETEAGQYIEIQGIRGIENGTALTTDRKLYETGLPEKDRPLRFASYGEPVFEHLLSHLAAFDMPACISEVRTGTDELGIEITAYAVACIHESGRSHVCLLTSLSDSDDLRLDETAVLTEEGLAESRKKLDDLIRGESDKTLSVPRLISENLKFARAQEIMSLMAVNQLLSSSSYQTPDEDIFRSELRRLDDLIPKRNRLQIPKLPKARLKAVSDYLMYPLQLPELGDTADVFLPIVYFSSGLDAVCRIVDGTKAKKNARIQSVRSQLRKQIQQKVRRLHL